MSLSEAKYTNIINQEMMLFKNLCLSCSDILISKNRDGMFLRGRIFHKTDLTSRLAAQRYITHCTLYSG